jgi:hypothetical protein
MNVWILFLSIVVMAYLVRYNKISSIHYENLVVPEVGTEIKDKRILVLDNQPALFQYNTLAVPFYEWSLLQPIVEQSDRYDHVLLIHRAFKKEMPEVIVDPKNLMEGFFKRLPELKEKYEKSPEGYRLIMNN